MTNEDPTDRVGPGLGRSARGAAGEGEGGDRGDESMGSTWSFLDITALGRQEAWEDSPEDYPQTPPYQWWNLHDEYGNAAA
jgi:predicted dithiol-disulfide oxidoreductase (DUF899 family)